MQLLYVILLSLVFALNANAGVFWRYNTSGAAALFDSGTDVLASLTSNPPFPCTEIFVGVHWAETSGTDFTVTTTYDGVAMTEIADTGFGPFLNVFKLANPNRGSVGIVSTFAGATGTGIATVISVLCYTGAASTEGVTNANGTSTTPSVTISTLTTGSAGAAFFTIDAVAGASTPTVGSGETQRVNRTAGTVPAANAIRALVSTQDMGGDGVMNYTLSASRTWYESAFGVTAGAKPVGVIGVGQVSAP